MASGVDQGQKFAFTENSRSPFNSSESDEIKDGGNMTRSVGNVMENGRQGSTLSIEHDDDQLLLENGKKCVIM